MIFIISFFFFVFGVLIGSFLNVVILRIGTGKGLGGRSFCFSCGKTLGFFELVPLFSFLFQRGKCVSCKSKISWQYPLVEALTGLVFLITFLKVAMNFGSLPLIALPFYLFAFSVLIAISVYDMRHKIVPDSLAFILGFFSFLYLISTHNASYFFNLRGGLDFFSGPILFLPFFILWYVSRGRWMGLGDGKLALGIGWMLPFSTAVSAVILGFWIGAGVSIILLLPHKFVKSIIGKYSSYFSLKSEIPFAPFLALGAFLAFIFEPDFFKLDFILNLL